MIRALAGVVALVLLLAGCGADDGPAMKIDWDLSRSHTMQDVNWPDPSITATDLRPIESLRIRFSGGREVAEAGGIRRVNVARDGERLVDMAIFSEPLTVDGAYRLALRWCKEWKLPTTQIDEWHANGGKDFNVFAYNPKEKLGLNHPSPSVEMLDSFLDEPRTVIVSLQFDWIVEAPKPPDRPAPPAS